jgi:hypothetical protein
MSGTRELVLRSEGLLLCAPPISDCDKACRKPKKYTISRSLSSNDASFSELNLNS